MNKSISIFAAAALALGVLAGCQITVEDLTPFEFRTVQVASQPPVKPVEPVKPTPAQPVKPVEPTPVQPVTPKDVVFYLGIDGVD